MGVPGDRRFLTALERINRVILGAVDVEQMLSDALDEALDIFECDRAWFLHPCDPASDTFQIPMERTRPEWPGLGLADEPTPMNDTLREVLGALIDHPGPMRFDPEALEIPAKDEIIRAFEVRSMMVMAIRPKVGPPWCFGIHNCEVERVYARDVAVFEAIGNRLADGLTTLLTQEELRRSEEWFRTLVEHAAEAIVIFDMDAGTFVEANSNAEELFGYSREELLRLGPAQLSPERQPDGEVSAEAITRVLERVLEGETPTFVWHHLNAAGEELPTEVRLVQLPSSDRRLVRGSITDIRERMAMERRRQELEAQLVQAQKMQALGQLTGGIAHDFNNIQTVIRGNTELALAELGRDHPAFELLSVVLQASRKASTLTQRLLAFSRKQSLMPRAIDMRRLIAGIEPLINRSLSGKIVLEISIPDELWKCLADPPQLENAILNLVINARDAMPEGGRLRIDARNRVLTERDLRADQELTPGEFVLLSVIDDGSGMSAEDVAKAFEPFYTTKAVGRGSGLGLSMVYGFVNQSKGLVRISSALGAGTTVELFLPRAPAEAPDMPERVEPEVETPAQGESILVVEDEERVRRFVVKALRMLGYRVHQAGTASVALELLREPIPVDLLLSDVVLRGRMSGVELVRQARTLFPELAVLLMSGYAANAIREGKGLDPGVELLGKPFSRDDLARAVRRVLSDRTAS